MDASPPEAGPDLDEAFRLLRHSRTLAARLEERRAALGLRTAELTGRVSLAKGRLLLKPDVDECLEAMQAESAGRTVGSFETLLSAFVSEVLPQAKPIGLQLTTERGQPALDISSMSANGTPIDIFEDDGGALTNVVVSALRLLAVVKSKGARFIALDEPDHWIKADRVPFFYHVFEEAARRLGIQCFAISHWDVRRFDTGMHISTIIGDPKDRCEIVFDKPAPEWPDDEVPGFRYVRLKNVQTLKDAEIGFGPGVNALTGDNGLGKSSLIRVFRAAFYGETRDGLISLGERGMEVEFGWSKGRFLRFSREIRRNPKDLWSYHEEDGSLVSDKYHTGGRGVPAWVNEIFGLGRQGPIDIHLSHQKKPLFLLEAPGSVRASILSVGREADYVADAMQIHKEQVKKDKDEVRDGEKEIASIVATMERVADTPTLAVRVEELETTHDDLVAGLREAERRRAALAAFAATAAALEGTEEALSRLASLRDRRSVDGLAEECRLRLSDRRLHAGAARSRDDLASASAAWNALSHLPRTRPELADTAPLRRTGAELRRLSTARAKASSEAEALAALPGEAPALAETAPKHATAARARRLSHEVESGAVRAAAYAPLPARSPELVPTAPMRTVRAQLSGRADQLAAVAKKVAVLAGLPAALPDVADGEALRLVARALADAASTVGASRRLTSLLEAAPRPPALADVSPLAEARALMKRAAAAASEAGKQTTVARAREAEARRRIDVLLAAGGGRCPTCGQDVDADTLLSAAHPHN